MNGLFALPIVPLSLNVTERVPPTSMAYIGKGVRPIGNYVHACLVCAFDDQRERKMLLSVAVCNLSACNEWLQTCIGPRMIWPLTAINSNYTALTFSHRL
jgi:hypothetical protein